MQIKDILGISNARLLVGNKEDALGHVCKDTRAMLPGDTYIAFRGEKFDGNDFYEQAFLGGAKTCILSHLDDMEEVSRKYADKNIILVDDTVDFIMKAASKKRDLIHVPLIAVTGSVGKTSTKNLIASVLEKKYTVLKTQGNLPTTIGLSLTLLNYQEEDVIVLEMGMNTFGEIRTLTHIAKPTIAVITNIGTSHIGNLGSRENILKAKLEILEGLSGPILVNNDNDLLHDWVLNEEYSPVITFGIEEESDYQAKDILYSTHGSRFMIGDEEYQIPVYGSAFIYNALVSLAIGMMLGVEKTDIKEALKSIPSEAHRMNVIQKKDITIIDDTYNANYDSVAFALEVLSSFSGRKIAVLGDILEMGDFSEEIHRKIGKLVVERKINYLITVGNDAWYINEEAMANGFDKEKSFHFNTNAEAITLLNNLLQKDDYVLVKASHSMNFIEIVEGMINE